MSIPFRLLIPQRLYQDMIEQAVRELPNECCGLLLGSIEADDTDTPCGRVYERFPLVNQATSPREYLSVDSLFAAYRTMREHGWTILAIYHSHPTSEPVPSRTDLARNFYGSEVMHMIISLESDEPSVRGWWLQDIDFREAKWQIV